MNENNMCRRRAEAYALKWEGKPYTTHELMVMAYEAGYIAGMCRRDDIREAIKPEPKASQSP